MHTPKSRARSSKSPEASKSGDAQATPVSGVTRLPDEARREEERKTPHDMLAKESKKCPVEGQSTPKQLKLEITKKPCSESVTPVTKNPVAKGTVLEGRGVSRDIQTTKKHTSSEW